MGILENLRFSKDRLYYNKIVIYKFKMGLGRIISTSNKVVNMTN